MHQLNDDHIETFVYHLSEYLDPLFPPQAHGDDYFDTDVNYEPLREFVFKELGKFSRD
jgi:hypothetical protein